MICLDSSCIIDLLKGKKEALDVVEKYKDELLTTEINSYEIFSGIFIKEEVNEIEKLEAENFFSSLEVLPFDSGCGDLSAKIFSSLQKIGQSIEENDCFIASIILKKGCNKIITRNKKHFERIKDLKVLSY